MKERHRTTHRKTGTEVEAGGRENEDTEGKLQEKTHAKSKAGNQRRRLRSDRLQVQEGESQGKGEAESMKSRAATEDLKASLDPHWRGME